MMKLEKITQADQFLYTAVQAQQIDQNVMTIAGIKPFQLMQQAGEAVFRQMRLCFPLAKKIIVLCGPGNNGGDGYIVATLSKQAGYDTQVLSVGLPKQCQEIDNIENAAWLAYQNYLKAEGEIIDVSKNIKLPLADVYIDALLGIGIDRPLSGFFESLVNQLNEQKKPIISVDIPTGLHADYGMPLGKAVKASITVSFIALKQGLFTALANNYCGRLIFAQLLVPMNCYTTENSLAKLISNKTVKKILADKLPAIHKGDNGKALLIGGNYGMAGSILLTAHSAMRVGCGLTAVITRQEHAYSHSSALPEVMWYGSDDQVRFKKIIDDCHIIAIGPGLGTDDWSDQLMDLAIKTEKPLIIDADGLRYLSTKKIPQNTQLIITPHPGEAAQLLDCSVKKITTDRYQAVRELVKRYHAVVVLKGWGSLIASPDDDHIWVCDRGNNGMAVAGMGDLLTGIMTGLYAQYQHPLKVAIASTFIHAAAGDVVANNCGKKGLLPSDLLPIIQQLINFPCRINSNPYLYLHSC